MVQLLGKYKKIAHISNIKYLGDRALPELKLENRFFRRENNLTIGNLHIANVLEMFTEIPLWRPVPRSGAYRSERLKNDHDLITKNNTNKK